MLYYDPDKNRSRLWATLAALAYLLVLVAVFLLVKCESEQDKPVIVGGVVIDFGTTETGAGENDLPDTDDSPVEPLSPPTVEQLTDDRSTVPVPVTPPAAPPRRADPNALFPGRTPGSAAASQGSGAGAGNAGSPEGSPGGEGTGDLGLPAHDLSGRSFRGTVPKPTYPGNESGRVVVEVTVDADGRVTYAAARARGSTTSSSALWVAAEEAARKTRFNESESLSQSGTITYIFRLN